MSGSNPIVPLIPSILPEEEVTIGRLSGLLEASLIDHEVDEDGDLFLSPHLGCPLWVSLDPERKLLHLSTVSEIDEDLGADWRGRVNRANRDLILTRFYLSGGAVWGDCSISYDHGLIPRQFLGLLRRFSGVFLAGLRLHKERQGQLALL